MTDLTTPSFRPFAGPCAAVHCEAPAPASTEAERLDRLDRAGPAALASHELLALLGLRLDAPALAAAGGCAGSATTPATPCASRRSARRPAPGPGPARSPRPLDGGAPAPRRLHRRPRRHPALRRSAAARLQGRGLRRLLPRHPPPRHRLRAALPRHRRQRERPPARGRAPGAGAQRRRRHLRPQPPLRRRRAEPPRPCHHRPPRGRPSPPSACGVLDHLVVGDGETVSFAERGWL